MENKDLIKKIDGLFNSFTGEDSFILARFYNEYYRNNKQDHKDDPFFSYYVKLMSINYLCTYCLVAHISDDYYCKKFSAFDDLCPAEFKCDMLMMSFRMVVLYHLYKNGTLDVMQATMPEESLSTVVDNLIKKYINPSDVMDALRKNIKVN